MNCTDCPYWYEWVGKEFPGCHYPSNDGLPLASVSKKVIMIWRNTNESNRYYQEN